jgi:hypothetical protein
MPDQALIDQLVQAATDMLNATSERFVDGEDVVRAIGRDPAEQAVYDSLREIDRRRLLTVEAWRGGMGLPAQISLP